MRTAVWSSIVGALLFAANGETQGVVSQPILAMATAKLVAETALAACTSQGFHTSVAVVDRAGNLLVVLRDELAHPVTIEMAQRKAQTAVLFRTSTLEFQQRTANDPSLAPQRNVAGVLALGGGVPIRLDGEIIGGVASSGSSQTNDDECARAGLAKADELLKKAGAPKPP
jgi:uncharacterized protein GlcG (DUF336 family)